MQNSVKIFCRKLSKSIFAFTKAFSLCSQQVIRSLTHNKKFLSLITQVVMTAVFLFRQFIN